MKALKSGEGGDYEYHVVVHCTLKGLSGHYGVADVLELNDIIVSPMQDRERGLSPVNAIANSTSCANMTTPSACIYVSRGGMLRYGDTRIMRWGDRLAGGLEMRSVWVHWWCEVGLGNAAAERGETRESLHLGNEEPQRPAPVHIQSHSRDMTLPFLSLQAGFFAITMTLPTG
jgi:hypothetical protein